MILNVYKEKDMTSRDVVNILSKHFKTKRVGHTGTLDPIATGVLIVCTDEDTKLVETLTAHQKEYIATMKLGIKTDTADITGKVIANKEYHVTKEQIEKVLISFLGKSKQTVPIYSAVKINGKKLYEYARDNIEIELPKKDIEVYDIKLLDYVDDIIKFQVTVSKGTYIRSLIEDIATKLDTYATMTSLLRTKQGDFKVEDSYTIEYIKNDNYKEISKDEVFKFFPKIILDDDTYFKVSNGVKLKLNETYPKVICVYKNKYVAIYKKDGEVYRMDKKLVR